MATFVLIPGAGGVAWYWHRVVTLLEQAGHEAIAVDLPGNDDAAGLEAYAGRVVDAIGARRDVVLVAQSLGGFTAPLVCARAPVRMLILVNAMIPRDDETAGEWWDDTGATAAREEAARRGGYGADFDVHDYFLHDVPAEDVAAGEEHQRPESTRVFRDPCRFEWPAIPIHVIAGRDDRFFPIDFQRRVARERLHATVDELPGGHLIALANPRGLVDRMLGYLREVRQLTADETRAGYDAWASSYDDGANPMVGASEWLLDRTPLGAADRDVLEIGCGTGRHIARVLAEGARSYTGVDPSARMLERARARSADPRVRLVEGDAAAPPVAEAAFDLALVVLVLEHLPDLAAPLRALARALRPGGRLRIVEIHPSLVAGGTVAHFADGAAEVRFASTAHPIASLRAALAAAGFVDVSLTEHTAAGALLAAVPRLGKHRDAPVVIDVTARSAHP